MNKTYQLSLHVFRRDLRLEDNSALITALQSSNEVIPCFILDDRQVGNNTYKSDHALQFMRDSLRDLDAQLKSKGARLYIFKGVAEEVIATLIESCPIEAVFMNRDYTPFSRERDANISKKCAEKNIDCHIYADALLHEPEQVFKPDRKPYTIYTPFANRARTLMVAPVVKNIYKNYYRSDIKFEPKDALNELDYLDNKHIFVAGGRREAMKLVNGIADLRDYKIARDFPAVQGTSQLSAHHKFGTVSIREVYWKIEQTFGREHTLINELYWRDFFTHIAFHFPNVFKQAFQEKFSRIKWDNNESYFRAWTRGETGFPIVDAGMRELNTTGYMHNRVRMIVASFLCKDLHINWRWGEKYFAKLLVDYDPCVNNGNWQWAASTGCDAQPYFRIFNPWLQQEKFDADCLYIKKWIPELAEMAPKTIHQLFKAKSSTLTGYPAPIVNHKVESAKSIALYKG